MHAKHRNGPGNGYRSNAIGMGGISSASRIPLESAMRGHRMYNSDYRNYNRGGGGGSASYGSGTHSKQQFQQPLTPQRGADVFVEAGKLAAEYLVSKGVLHPNALSGKCQGVDNFPVFRPHEVEMHPDGRGSSHSRLGNAVPDVGPGRRRYSDDHNLMSSRNSVRERKRTGSFKNYGLEANRELGRSGSWAEKANASPSMDVDGNAYVGRRDEKVVVKDSKGGTQSQSPSPGEMKREVASEARIESNLEKSKLLEDAGANNVQPDAADRDRVKNSDDAGVVGGKNDDDDDNDDDEGLTSADQFDLVKHSKIVNVPVPTKARSSLTKNSQGDQDPMDKDENIYGGEILENSGVHVIDVDVDNSAGNASSLQSPEFKEPTMNKEPESDDGLSAFGRSNSVVMERGEKLAMDFDIDVKEDVKRLRQWVPVLDARSNGSPSLSCSTKNHSLLPDQKSLDISIFPNEHADSCDLIEEKQLFPSSFKTCDLNLVGNVDVSENHDGNRVLVFPSVMELGNVETPIDVDLSISKNSKNVINANEIEVIDLEKDSAPEDRTFSDPERRGDTVFSGLDGFPSDAHNANGIHDVQDGYGLMMSEFLGHDSPNVPGDLNSLHNHMDLPNGEGILGDDDSIYMSLGEIPISLLGAWEQPSQDYGKPF